MSLLAGLAQTDTQLAICRLLQGGFAGISNPQVSGMIQQMFRGAERGRAFGLFGAVIGVSTALGPIIGGVILAIAGTEHGWRWVFFINVPICLVVVPLAKKFLPAPPEVHTKQRLDFLGLVLIGVATMCFMFPFVTTPDDGFFNNMARWWWVIPAFALAPITYLWERHYQRKTSQAVLNPGLLRTVSYRYGAALGLAYFAGFTALMLVITMLLQTGLGYSALMAGVVSVPYAIASGFTAQQSGRLVTRHGRVIVVIGLAVSLIGMLACIAVIRFAPVGAIGWALAAALFVTGAGNGAVISPNQTLTFQDVPPALGSVAGAVMQVGQRVGSAVGTAVVLAVYFSTYSIELTSLGQAEAAESAASDGLLISAALIAFALVIAIGDWRRRSSGVSHPVN
jgi:MFS family permease